MPRKSNVIDKDLIKLLNLVNGGSLCFLSPQDKEIMGGDVFIKEKHKAKKRKSGK